MQNEVLPHSYGFSSYSVLNPYQCLLFELENIQDNVKIFPLVLQKGGREEEFVHSGIVRSKHFKRKL